MAIVEYTCLESSLYFYGAFKLQQYPAEIAPQLDYLYSEVFIDPWDNWDLIKRVFETFGSTSTVSNASFSKNEDIGDGVKTTWMLNSTSNGVLVQCYNIANELGILVDPEACKITFAATLNSNERVNRKKWQALATQYQKIKNIQTTQTIVAFGVSPIIDSTETLERSPQQLQMYQNYLAGTSITAKEQYGADITESTLYKVPKQTSDVLFGDVTDILRGGSFSDLSTLSPTGVEYSFETVLETTTSDDVSNNYIDFSALNYVVHLEYAVRLPEDTTGDVSIVLKECYGIEYGDSQSWDCATCEYADDCASADFINPFDMDDTIQNRLHNDSLILDQRIRFKYKRVEIT